MERKQFTFYRSYYEAMQQLSPRYRSGFLEALVAYALDGIKPEKLNATQWALFILCKPTMDAGRKQAKGASYPKKTFSKEKEKEKEKEIEKEIETEIEKEDEESGARAFEKFWMMYPVKVDKAGTQALWNSLGLDAEEVMRGLLKWCSSEQWAVKGGRYIPRATKFLREQYYLSPPVGQEPCGARGELGQAEVEAIQKLLGEEE